MRMFFGEKSPSAGANVLITDEPVVGEEGVPPTNAAISYAIL